MNTNKNIPDQGDKEEWEERFDKQFCSFNLKADQRCKECLHKTFDGSSIADHCGSADEYIKDFIREERAKEYERGRIEERESNNKLLYPKEILDDYRKQLKGKIKGIKKDTHFWDKTLTNQERLIKAIFEDDEYLGKEYCDGYNQAILEVLELINNN